MALNKLANKTKKLCLKISKDIMKISQKRKSMLMSQFKTILKISCICNFNKIEHKKIQDKFMMKCNWNQNKFNNKPISKYQY